MINLSTAFLGDFLSVAVVGLIFLCRNNRRKRIKSLKAAIFSLKNQFLEVTERRRLHAHSAFYPRWISHTSINDSSTSRITSQVSWIQMNLVNSCKLLLLLLLLVVVVVVVVVV